MIKRKTLLLGDNGIEGDFAPILITLLFIGISLLIMVELVNYQRLDETIYFLGLVGGIIFSISSLVILGLVINDLFIIKNNKLIDKLDSRYVVKDYDINCSYKEDEV